MTNQTDKSPREIIADALLEVEQSGPPQRNVMSAAIKGIALYAERKQDPMLKTTAFIYLVEEVEAELLVAQSD